MIPEIHVSSDGRRIYLHGACNAQYFSFVSQEHDIPDYFQVILQTSLNPVGHALSNWGGISAGAHYPHGNECGLPVLAQLAGAVVGLPQLRDETNAMLFLLLAWHV